MKMSETIAALATALSAAQGEIDDATKESRNDHYKSKYADLAAVRSVIREPLAKHGLSVVQCLRSTPNGVECETILMHKTGEFMSEVLEMPLMKRDAHGVGSAATYARRYGLMGILCIASDDDDGNAATIAPAAQPAAIQTPKLSPKEIDALFKLGVSAAYLGSENLTNWWKSLTPDQRNSLTRDQVSGLKGIAKEADTKETTNE